MSFEAAIILLGLILVGIGVGVLVLKSRRLDEQRSGGWLDAASLVNLTVSRDDRLRELVKRHRVLVDVRRREQGVRSDYDTVLRMNAPPGAAGLSIRSENTWTRMQKLVRGEDVLLHDDDFDQHVHVQGDAATVVGLLDEKLRARLLVLVEEQGCEVDGSTLSLTLPGVVNDAGRLFEAVEELVRLRDALEVKASVDDRLAHNAAHDGNVKVRLRNLALLAQRDPRGRLTRATASKLLLDEEAGVRLAAARLLLDEPSFQVLGALVQSTNHPELRQEALELLLEHWNYGRCKPWLEVAVGSGQPGLSVRAIKATVDARDPFLLPQIVHSAGLDDAKLAATAAHALNVLGDVSHEQVLLPLLDRDNDEVKLAAARALGFIGTVASVESLLSLTSDPRLSRSLKEAAREAIRRIQARAGPVERGQLSLVDEHEASGRLSLSLDGGELSLEGEAPKEKARLRE